MTFKQIAHGLYLLPGTVFSGLTNLFLGSYEKNAEGDIKLDEDNHPKTKRGLFGLAIDGIKYLSHMVLDGAKYLARGFANFISNHKDAIAIAFWASLIIGGAVALTVALWPAALVAIAGFPVYGVSIASVVGTGFAAQVAAIGGLAAIATSVGVYISAGIVNTIRAIASCCSGRRNSSPPIDDLVNEQDDDIARDADANLRSSLGGLNNGAPRPDASNDLGNKPVAGGTSFLSAGKPPTLDHQPNHSPACGI